MSRELKFRALFELQEGGTEWRTTGINEFHGDRGDKQISQWLQYVGLTDKNGVEIYEGDIVNMVYDEPYDRPHIVVYLEKSAKWIAIHVIEHEAFKSGMREIYFANTGKVPNLFNATVIGDIHSNPELLTPKQ